jgi:ABC-type phosphate transport system auxiliary subunit
MSTKDHNKTLVMLYAAIGSFYSCGIIAAPWIIEKNFRRPGQIPSAMAVFGIVFLIALLFWSSAILYASAKAYGKDPSAHCGAVYILRLLADSNLHLGGSCIVMARSRSTKFVVRIQSKAANRRCYTR